MQIFGLSLEVVYNKIIVLKNNLLIMKNIIKVIYKRQNEFISLY